MTMRRRTLLLALLGLPAPRRLRVLSYNVHHGEGTDGRIDLARIAEVIRRAAPDVAMLQEVDRGVARSGGVDQPARLAALTGMRPYFGKAIEHQGGDYGNAILTGLAVADHGNFPLPGAEPRACIWIRTEDGLLFLGTHLDVGRDDTRRVASAERINEWIEARADLPAILAGDLNAVRGSAPLGVLARRWSIAGEEIPTSPATAPRRQIDFILHRPAARWRVVDVQVPEEPVASDHRPIAAALELLPAPAAR